MMSGARVGGKSLGLRSRGVDGDARGSRRIGSGVGCRRGRGAHHGVVARSNPAIDSLDA